mmetsp:Transcript_6719/g.9067  ORF Transcript_6719/g.9067 Transcript_6719/m.9067 type:complete len:423 (-) Transcript_6719:111-1379(-)|eukprot:CAMPEP_0185729312 /NCGR_PEP_ID=MMETSP1171-20130828/5088_1 /TAXON_ID=374046 /ORGANISM="Helicotheca tamensis, Strain CCMP826" /LENGTH=422 /DNA_ID=CAMNT_0028398117 /DNA_START=68 /DNA_END=1336 /DNA_ORIENTATION=-
MALSFTNLTIKAVLLFILLQYCSNHASAVSPTKVFNEKDVESLNTYLKHVIEGDIADIPFNSVFNNKDTDSFFFTGNSDSRHLQYSDCDPEDVVLADSVQWEKEEGYWIGDLTFLMWNGDPNISDDWPYMYDHYKGFITGNVQGNKYRQRNIFLYPPLADTCPSSSKEEMKISKKGRKNRKGKKNKKGRKKRNGENGVRRTLHGTMNDACTALKSEGKITVVGNGTCGVNGNTKVFRADQEAKTCSTNPERQGEIEGPFGSLTYTYTTLVGRDNALLYQVFITKSALNYFEAVVLGDPAGRCIGINPPFVYDCGYTEDRILQSQLTTLTSGPDGVQRRTRTAQIFDAFGVIGMPVHASFYREYKVDEEEFRSVMLETQMEYNILDEDMGAWASDESNRAVDGDIGGTGIDAVMDFLNTSFDL